MRRAGLVVSAAVKVEPWPLYRGTRAA